VLGLAVRIVHADPPASQAPPQTASSAEPTPRRAEPTTTTPVEPVAEPAWEDAPRPDAASGIERDAPKPWSQRLRVIPRAVLFLPRMVVWAVAQPFRLGAYAYEKLDLTARTRSALSSTDETFGIYPAASYESNFGIIVGVRIVNGNMFGQRERLKLRVDVGTQFRQAYGFSARSGERFGDLVLELGALYERRPNERFYGIGNGDAVEQPPPRPIDPTVDETAIATRFREDILRSIAVIDGPLGGGVMARLTGVALMRAFEGTGDDDSIEMHYDTARVPGYVAGVESLYLEAELAYDTRRPTSRYQSRVVDATGWLATAYFGAVEGLDDDPSDYYRYGGEVQRFFDLYRGSRVLALRVMADAVGGTDGRTDGKIAFVDLPRLGGADYLRGYPSGRFRDRAVGLATAEYTWDLGNFLAAFTFVDVGRAWYSLADIEWRDMRVGYGGGVQFHTNESFILRGQIAASRDGDLFLELALSPAFGRRERVGRF